MDIEELRSLLGSARCFAVEPAPGGGWLWSVQVVSGEPNSIAGMQGVLERVLPALLDVAEAAERLEEVNTRVRAERHQLQLSGMDVVDATATATGKHGVAFLAARDALAAALARLKEA